MLMKEYQEYLFKGFESGKLSGEAYKYALENIEFLYLDEDYRYLEWLYENDGLDNQFDNIEDGE